MQKCTVWGWQYIYSLLQSMNQILWYERHVESFSLTTWHQPWFLSLSLWLSFYKRKHSEYCWSRTLIFFLTPFSGKSSEIPPCCVCSVKTIHPKDMRRREPGWLGSKLSLGSGWKRGKTRHQDVDEKRRRSDAEDAEERLMPKEAWWKNGFPGEQTEPLLAFHWGAKAWVTEEEEKRCWQMLAGVLAGDRRSILPSVEHLLCKAIGWWNTQFSGATFCIFANLLLVMLFLFHNSVPRLIWRKHNWILYCQIFLSPDKALYLYSTTGTSKDRVCCKGIVGRSCWSPGFPSCSAPRSSSWRRGWTAAGSRWSRNWQGPTRTQTVSDLV